MTDDGAPVDDVAARVAETIRAVLGRPELVVTDDLVAAHVDGWDSVAHVELIYAIEGEFGITFPADAILRHEDVGSLRRNVEQLVGGGR